MAETPEQKLANIRAEIIVAQERLNLLKAEQQQQAITIEQQKELLELRKELKELAIDELDARQATNERVQDFAQQRALLVEQLKQEEQVTEQILAQLQRQIDITDAVANSTRGLAEELSGMIPVIGGNVEFTSLLSGQLAAAAVKTGDLGSAIGETISEIGNFNDRLQLSTNVLAAVEEAAGAFLLASSDLTVQVFDLEAGLARATGAFGDYDSMLNAVSNTASEAGVTFEVAADSIETLRLQSSRFTAFSEQNQQALSNTTAVLNQLGVDASTTATNVDIMTTALGQTSLQAEDTSRRLFTAAQAIGVAPQRMAEDFSAAGKQMASFGENAIDVFLDLSEVAKKTGIELTNLLSITEKFTTFEGAADTVGRLNALLGGPFLNTIDLTTAALEDPASAALMIRDAIDEANISFEDMNPAMRRAIANAAGLEDASQLAALMSGELGGMGTAANTTAQELEELQAATAFTLEFGQQLEATALAFLMNLEPVIDFFAGALQFIREFVGGLNEITGGFGGPILAITSLGVAGTFAFGALRTAIATVTGPVATLTTELTTLNANLSAITTTAPTAGAAINTTMAETAPAAAAAGTSLTSVALAILAIGAGIGLAAAGMAAFVASFSLLTPEQTEGVATGIFALTASFGALALALGFFGSPLGLAAAGSLTLIGVAVGAIGVGIGAAVAGISLLVSSIAEMGQAADEIEKISAAFEEMSIPKLVTFTTAMRATAAVAETPAAAAIVGATAAVTGTGAPAAGPQKVEVKIEGSMRDLFKIMDKRYTQRNITTPGQRLPSGYLASS